MPISAPRPKLVSIGEGGRHIDIDTGGIHLADKAVGMSLTVGDDTLTMVRAVATDLLECLLQRTDRADGHLVVQEFRTVMFRCGRLQQGVGIRALQRNKGRRIGIDGHPLFCQGSTELRQISQTGGMEQETVEGIADAHPTCLGIADNVAALAEVTELISWILNLIKETLWK